MQIDHKIIEAADWTVQDSQIAGHILLYLGIATDPSLEPYADRRRDKIASMIAGLREQTEREAIRKAAEVARNRYTQWRMPHPDDAAPGEVCCDVTACEDTAAAILALLDKPAPDEPPAQKGDAP
jgi:hypothetical protein